MKYLISLLFAAFAAMASAVSPGITVSVSAAGVNYVMAQLVPAVEAAMKDIHIEGISDTALNFNYKVSNIHCPGFQIGGAGVVPKPPSLIVLALTDFRGQCKANWSFWFRIWPNIPQGSGSVSITFSNTNALAGLTFGVDAGRPRVISGSSSITIGSLDITFSGGITAALLNVFRGFISKAIKNKLNEVITPVMNNFINNQLNAILAKLSIIRALPLVPPYNIASIRYGLTDAPTIGHGFIGVGFQGDIVNTDNPVNPPISPSTLPGFSSVSSSHYMEIKLSAYTLLSAAHTFIAANLVHKRVPSSDLPKGLGITSGYVQIAPGLASAYPDRPVSIHFTTAGMPILKFKGGGTIEVAVPAQAHFFISGRIDPVFILNIQADLKLSLTLSKDDSGTPIALSPKLAYAGISIYLHSTAVGAVHHNLLADPINFLLKEVLIPIANEIVAPGIPFPVMAGFKLTNFDLNFVDDYISLGTNFEFNPYALSEFTEAVERGRMIDEAMKYAERNGVEYKALRASRA